MKKEKLAKTLIIVLFLLSFCFACLWLNAEKQASRCHIIKQEIKNEKEFYKDEYFKSIDDCNQCVKKYNKLSELANEISGRTLEIVNGAAVSPEEFREYATDIIKMLEDNEKIILE